MCIMEVAIAVNGFRGRDWKFLAKEIAITTVTGNILGHWIIAPPYPFTDLPDSVQAENNRRTQEIHKIEWFEGEASADKVYQNVYDIVRSATTIYTVGEESRLFLKKLICRDVRNVETFRNWKVFVETYPTRTMCILHAVKCHPDDNRCAIATARQIKKWLIPISLPPAEVKTETEL